MPTISYDKQSFMVDGRRIWLVSGAIHYPRVPREQWRDRILAAKQAGLNCIETYVFWNVHEPAPGEFNFEGEADLRAFVQMVGEEGLYCIIRPGPYVCAEWDFGGLPPWLTTLKDIAYRERNSAYLEACARYLGALMEQLADLQITAGGGVRFHSLTGVPGGGPIVLFQAENEWMCHNPEQGQGYLREMARFLQENGCEVPIVSCNNLWQRVDGTLDTWNGHANLLPILRQLRVVQPEAPRLVTEFWPGWFDQWDGEHHRGFDADLVSYRLAQVLAAGAQFNLYMFHGGTNFGFYGGRSLDGPACFMTTSYDYDAPLREGGGRGEKYHAVRRLSTFASQFGYVFAHLDPELPHTTVTPKETDHPVSIVHQSGSQGEVVMIMRSEDDDTESLALLMPDGVSLDVPMGEDRVAWMLRQVNLSGMAELTYSNLRPFGFFNKKMLVLFGPAGADGIVALDDSPLEVTVPTGKKPLVEVIEDITLVVLNGDQIDVAYLTDEGLTVGAASIGEDGKVVPHSDWPQQHLVQFDGKTGARSAKAPKKPTAPTFGKWKMARLTDLIDGSDKRYEPIEGPDSLEALGAPFGYGWYRIEIRGANPKASQVLAPEAGDRLHIFQDGLNVDLLGIGPGASDEPTGTLPRDTTVVLADNLGRFNIGWNLGERKGLFGHFREVKRVKLGKATQGEGPLPDPFEIRGYWHNLRQGERYVGESLTWTVKPQGRQPMVLDIRGFPAAGMIIFNDKPIAMCHPTLSAGYLRLNLIVGEDIKGGRNELTFHAIGPLPDKAHPDDHIRLYQTTTALTEKANWAFTPWAIPDADAFGTIVKSAPAVPCWFRGTFNVSRTDVPLLVEPNGMSKGQIILNGHNVGRYFIATATGKKVGPQERYYLPEAYLKTDEPNELLFFDEHGKSPAKAKLAYDPMGPYGK